MPAFSAFGSDLRFTGRLFRKNPAFTLMAIASMALGIGASSAIFSLVYAVLFDPYPYRDADRIIALRYSDHRGLRGQVQYTIPDFLEVRRGSTTFEDAFLVDQVPFIATAGLPDQVRGVRFSPNAFDFMGVPALRGRTFTPADIPYPQTPPRVAVISYLFWQHHFNKDPQAVGKRLELNHQPYTVMGVLPPRFTWNDGDVYVPMAMVNDFTRAYTMRPRVKAGVKPEAVNAEMQTLTERFAKRSPDVYPKEFHLHAQGLNDYLLGSFKGMLMILLAAVGFLLLIACGNVSILLLARAAARRKEIAVRVALGASRARILRHLLTESVALSLAGGLAGVALAWAGVPLLVAMMPEYSVPHEVAIQVNGAVVLFAFCLATMTGILFGMAPALQLVKTDVRDTMQETGRSSSGSTRAGKMRSALIVAEVALTLVLLTGAGIAMRGLLTLLATPRGFDAANVLTAQMNLPVGGYGNWEARTQHFNRTLERVRSTPGVIAAAGTFSAMPPYINASSDFELPGRQVEKDQKVRIGLVSADYFATLRVPVLLGSAFSESDVARARRVGVINEEMRRRYWPQGNPIGSQIRLPLLDVKGEPDIMKPADAREPIEIVGVVATVRNRGLNEPAEPAIYVPWTRLSLPYTAFLIRTAGDPQAVVNSVRERVRDEDHDQPLAHVATLEESLLTESAYQRFGSTLFSVFAGVALLLAASGLYSVVSFVVARRTHEFGIRMALGARGVDVLRLVGAMTGRLVLTGIAIGLVVSVVLNRLVASHLANWNASDPVAFGGVVVTLIATALLAALFPARRAVTIQPMRALRHE